MHSIDLINRCISYIIMIINDTVTFTTYGIHRKTGEATRSGKWVKT